ncbi:MAG TPA: arginase [Bacteroidia bacterium]|jgi:arginase|nr:arginase [Bacteroidia bacterium]
MKAIKIIEVKSEIGAGTRGSSMGIDAIKIAAMDFGSYFFKKNKTVRVPVENKLLLEPIHNEYAKRIKGIYAVNERLANEVKKAVEAPNTFPIVLLGDHSSSYGTIAGVKMACPDKRLGLIWIDAHADIHSPYTTPSGNMHGMPISAMIDDDNLESRVNNPDEETIEYWEKLKNMGGIKPKVLPSDIIYVGLRDTEAQENYLIKKHGIRVYTVAEIRTKGVERAAVEVLNYLDKCDIIHISFDVDSMDPSISRGTGTPAKNGITEREAGNFISRLLYSKKIASFEIAEINPTLDHENIMAENAFEILQKAANQITRVV